MWCALFLILSGFIICSCTDVQTHNIYPETTCPNRNKCLTLLDIVNERVKYFTSDSTLVFHDGEHILQGKVVSASNISNFTIQANSGSSSDLSSPMITCVNSSLSFSDVSISITSIVFNHCSISLAHTAAVVQDSRFENSSAAEGGALAVLYSSVQFDGVNWFAGNVAEYVGGALYSHHSTVTFSGTTVFTENKAQMGGAVYCESDNSLNFSGSNVFLKNTAGHTNDELPDLFEGGAVYAAYGNSLNFNGSSSFMSNTAVMGGAVGAWSKNTLSFNGNSSFVSNTAEYGGGAVFAANGNTLSFDGKNSFMNNTVGGNGGVVYVWYHIGNNLSFHGSSSFMGNVASNDGGALYIENSGLSFHGSSIFVNNVAARGGGIALFSNSHLHSFGTTCLLLNTASSGGGAFVQDSRIDSIKNIAFIGNKARYGGGLFVQSSNITFKITGLLAGNTATSPEGGYGGAILSLGSIVEFQGSFDITNNTADFGGGLALFGFYNGVLIIKDGTNLTFKGSLAHRRGGAIYVEDNPFTFCAFDNDTENQVDELCFFQTRDGPYNCFRFYVSDHHQNFVDYLAKSIILKFDGNTADVSGDILYGGNLESCVVCSAPDLAYKFYTLGAATFHHYAESVYSKLSSDPYKVCICEDSQPNCDLREVNRTVYPGQVLVTSVVAVGQMNGTVPSVIRAVSDVLSDAPDLQETQAKNCSRLQYSLFSIMSNTSLKLYSDEPCSTSGYPLTFLISFLPCPVGYTLSERGACICDERLQKYTQNCAIENLTISRNAGDSFWVGVEGTDKLILHPHCPFDYCIEEPSHFPLNSTDMQCANGRSGILCGACQPGRGLALGSSRCLSDCSNGFLALLLAFAFAGVALVAFLFLCRLTVAEGTLSGLIFYANVLEVNQTVFFPSGERNLLTVFVAWLDLDLGIETCFFVSLDIYYKIWLQFAFPIYIWVIVGAIIVLADRSTAFAKIIGNTNPVAVLATLFLLSYTKLLRAIMAAFSFASLDYPDGDSKYVWLYDGNVGYLERHDGRHIALFLFSLLFLLFVFLPYTLLLLCGQWIQKQLWWLSSTKQLYLKFFLDAHYGPYKKQHRYWTGLLLLLRFLMLFVATIININNPQDPYSNLLVILVVSSSLIVWGWVVGRIYKKWYQDALEASFILNLVVLAGATVHVRQSGGNQAALVYTSVSIAFVIFFGIVLSAVVKRVKEKVAEHRRRALHYPTNDSPDNKKDSVQLVPAAAPASAVTYSVLEIVRRHPDQTSGEIELRPQTSESPHSAS